jgi:hypothetical protein
MLKMNGGFKMTDKKNDKTIVENMLLYIAEYILPKKLVFICAVIVVAHALEGKHKGTDRMRLLAVEALARFAADNGLIK